MTVRKKEQKPSIHKQYDIDEIINRGGRPTNHLKEKNSVVRIPLRISQELVDLIDQERERRPGNVSRNQWIAEVLTDHLHK